MYNMSINFYSIKSLLNIKDENIIFDDGFYSKKKINYQDTHIFYAKLTYNPSACTCCGVVNENNIIVKNGFKLSTIKLLPICNLPAILKLKKQRFLCRDCSCSFMASSTFVDSYCNISNDVKNAVLSDLMDVASIKDIAKKWFISSSSVLRVLKRVSVLKKDFSYLPEFICMDEFKSVRSESFNMSFVFMDALSRKIIDILPDRRIHKLIAYFNRFPMEIRKKVKGVVIDMYEPYISLIKDVFPNASIIFDRFHVVQNLTRALDKTRISVMNSLDRDSKEYKVLKRYWRLFLKYEYDLNYTNFYRYVHFNRLMSQASVVSFMRGVNPFLDESYKCIQDAMAAIRLSDTDMLQNVINRYEGSKLISEKVRTAITTTKEYEKYIENAVKFSFSNGPLEGTITKIKLIKRISYGYRNFNNLKRRIILCMYKLQYIEKDPGVAS